VPAALRRTTQSDRAGLELRGRGAFLFLGLVPVLLTAALLWAVQQFRSDARWVDHTHDVLAALSNVDTSVMRAESVARAYFVTRDENQIAQFAKFRTEVESAVTLLRELVSDNPSELSKVARLREIAESRIDFLERNVRLLQAGTSLVTLGAKYGAEGRVLISALEQQVADIRSDEEQLLMRRRSDQSKTNRILSVLCGSAMLVSLAVALRGDYMIRKYRDLRDGAEARLQAANDQLENRVHERTRELERSNIDLRQFTYAASHDLNEPLRTIGIYTELLRRRYLSKLDADADQVIRAILNGVSRMDALLSGLRAYMQVSSLAGDEAPWTELRSGLDAALLDLKAALEECGASVHCETLPKLQMHPLHARQIFQNLIANAAKYRGAEAPVISISSDASNHAGRDEWVIRVRDNGMGIAPRYHAQIFELFKRLHTSDHIPGSGLGLAICRTIVHQYGGRIWVESELNQGSTFSFAVPRRK
jgi:signal transduction histidine kinase